MSEATRILHAMQQGDSKAAEELLPLVYEELRRLAAHKMSLQPPGQTLQATALVHEAYLRLLGNEEKRWENRRHFFSAAAEAMRHILIDRARRRLRARHGEGAEKVPLDEVEIVAPAKDEIVLQLNEALEKLAQTSPEQAEIVKLRFFAGFTEPEIAEILNLSERSVQRQWSYAKAWLFERIEAEKGRESHRPKPDEVERVAMCAPALDCCASLGLLQGSQLWTGSGANPKLRVAPQSKAVWRD